MSYGFVGLGQMGAPMAKHLIPHGLVAYDTRPEAVQPLVDAGATAAKTLADLAGARLVSLMVRDDAQVREVCAELLPVLGEGAVLAIHSTISPGTAVDLAAEAAPHGIEVVDAPVSGGSMGAAAGTLAVMVGGTDDGFAACQEAFGAWADLVLHMGPVGAGTRTKLARNLLHFVAFAAAGEAQRLAEASGVSLRRLGRIVRHSDAITGGPGSIVIRPTNEPMTTDDPLYSIMHNALLLGEKDLTLAMELADELGVETPFAHLAMRRLAAGLGIPEEDK